MPQVALIGSGIVGLTTALEIQSNGHEVTILAESLPGDEKSTRYTSAWAGANHVSQVRDDPAQLEFERETFNRLWAELGKNSEEGRHLMRCPLKIYFEDTVEETQLDHMPDFRLLTAEELHPSTVCGIAFTTLTIDPSTYLPFLLARFLGRGGQIRRVHVQHIDQVLHGAWGIHVPDALVVCPGIGARFLGGVEDKDIYPIRGQTVRVRAPWLKQSKIYQKNGEPTYIIPRRNGDVILGGTYLVNDWYPHARLETGRSLLSRAIELMPELIPRSADDAESPPPTVADLEALVIEHGCGLRPGRKGGIRLEGGMITVVDGTKRREVPVVYNYGHGGAGYQASWGSASAAARLLEDALG